jgi:hypothetical protein
MESSKRQQRDGVWVITYTHNIDDYKPRGRAPSSEVRVYASCELCEQDLKEYIIEKVNEELSELDEAPSEIIHCLKGYDEDVEDGQDVIQPNKPFEVDPESDIDELYEYIAKGEFVEYKWTYDISFHAIRQKV